MTTVCGSCPLASSANNETMKSLSPSFQLPLGSKSYFCQLLLPSLRDHFYFLLTSSVLEECPIILLSCSFVQFFHSSTWLLSHILHFHSLGNLARPLFSLPDLAHACKSPFLPLNPFLILWLSEDIYCCGQQNHNNFGGSFNNLFLFPVYLMICQISHILCVLLSERGF